jgi:hypothetical protein
MRWPAFTLSLLIALITSPARATPVADGRFDPSEGYTTQFDIHLDIEKGVSGLSGAELWQHVGANGDVSIALILPVTLVDNSYGIHSIGWGSDAPTGKHHNFKDLKGSDKAQFVFTDDTGAVVLDFDLDYLTAIGSGWGASVESGDGRVRTGSASDILGFGTSLDFNLNALGYSQFTENSPEPAVPGAYPPPGPPSAPGWIFEVIYEIQVSHSVFGSAEFGGFDIPVLHASPNKLGKNKVFPKIGDPIPEPSTAALLSLGLIALAASRRRSAPHA